MNARALGFPDREELLPLVRAALGEDRADSDVTTLTLVDEGARGRAFVETRHDIVVAGLPLLLLVFAEVDPEAKVCLKAAEGSRAVAGTRLATVAGSLRSLLSAERTALNFVQRTCGVATATRRMVDAVAGTDCIVMDTRKTVPGWRLLDKYAVRAGGGVNHRLGLWDAVLIKENHIDTGVSPEEAVRRCREAVPDAAYVEIEVRSRRELASAVRGRPDVIMLDNFSVDEVREAVEYVRRECGRPRDGGPHIEVSGGIGPASAAAVASLGVDRISIGAITHSAHAADIALSLERVGGG